MSYTGLTADKDTEGSIKYFVRHSIVPSASILESAQGLIYSLLRVREMKVLATGTIAQTAYTLPVPINFMEPVTFWLAGSTKNRVRILDEDHFETRVARDVNDVPYSGTPSECTCDATKFYFNASADINYLYRLWYMARPALLAAGTNETNFLTTRYPHLLDAACKYYAYVHREQMDLANQWIETAKGAIDQANGEYDLYKQQIQHEMFWEN